MNTRETEAVQVIRMLTNLVYELMPDDEYLEDYGIPSKLAQATACVVMLEGDQP